MWHPEDKKRAKDSGELAVISAALLVLLISLGMNGLPGSNIPATEAAAGLPAATRFEPPKAQHEDSAMSLGSASHRGHSISLMIFRLN